MATRTEIIETHPDFPWLDLNAPCFIESYLRNRGWVQSGETFVSATKAGEGNMNLTLRIQTSNRSFILKQARPWVEKYDHISAPWDRILYEQGFYQRVQAIPEVAGAMPALIASSAPDRLILLEDLAGATDFTGMYAGGAIEPDELRALARYLRALHDGTRGKRDPEFVNREMRMLNHIHIFVVPVTPENGLDIDRHEAGLSIAAARLRRDAQYMRLLHETGERYLAEGPCLVHGDFFPGSWLRTRHGVRVIDPEFCYYGDPEFDIAVCAAHLRMSQQPFAAVQTFIEAYGERTATVNGQWIARYAAAEVMRRLIGVAQLPIPPSDGQRAEWLEQSHRAMLSQTLFDLWE